MSSFVSGQVTWFIEHNFYVSFGYGFYSELLFENNKLKMLMVMLVLLQLLDLTHIPSIFHTFCLETIL